MNVQSVPRFPPGFPRFPRFRVVRFAPDRDEGVPYSGSQQFDLDFESESTFGFHAGGEGHVFTIDKNVAHTGKQALRSLARLQDSPDKKQLAQACTAVLGELEGMRAALLQLFRASDVDWAIQNARLVLQYMQLQTGEQSRDQSMAENVQWIVRQNPGARIALWAHNGHIAYTADYGPMGGYLHKSFGNHLVNFGFSFDEGSFRAIEPGKSLHDFTVGPAPEESLDHALASTGIPFLALDLRRLPQRGPVAQWFTETRDSRSIGALYGGTQPASWSVASLRWPEAFDVIVFVETITASHGNP